MVSKRDALEAINLIKEKRTGKIKGCTCADGRKQRKWINKEDTASPTVSLEALITSLLIDAFEERDVATFDVPGAYLNAKMPDDQFVLLRFRNEFADIMCEVNPVHRPNLQTDPKTGNRVLYICLLKCLYGSGLHWYNLYVSVLKENSYVLNPYDLCTANRALPDSTISTIQWYVDNNKVSHVDPKVNDDIIKKIKEHFGKLTITRGKNTSFLACI